MCSPLLWPILCREAGRRPLCRAAEICSASGHSEGSSLGAERWSGSGIFAWRKGPDSRGENPLGDQVELRGKSIGSNRACQWVQIAWRASGAAEGYPGRLFGGEPGRWVVGERLVAARAGDREDGGEPTSPPAKQMAQVQGYRSAGGAQVSTMGNGGRGTPRQAVWRRAREVDLAGASQWTSVGRMALLSWARLVHLAR